MLFTDVAHMPHAFSEFQSAFHHSAIISFRLRMCASFFSLSFYISPLLHVCVQNVICMLQKKWRTDCWFYSFGNRSLFQKNVLHPVDGTNLHKHMDKSGLYFKQGTYVGFFNEITFILIEMEKWLDHNNWICGCVLFNTTLQPWIIIVVLSNTWLFSLFFFLV